MVCASVAQSVEQETENLRVGGSIPPRGTNYLYGEKISLVGGYEQKFWFRPAAPAFLNHKTK